MLTENTSLKRNYVYNTINQITNVFFHLLTLPYIPRILGPEYLGKVNFAQSFVQYFIIIASLGIEAYAIREISKARNDSSNLSKLFSELFSLLLISSFIMSLVYISNFLFLDKFRYDPYLFLIVGISLFLNQMSTSWFLAGTENFKYILIRNLIVKFIFIVILFGFVKTPNDYLIYATILSFYVFGANIIDFLFSYRILTKSGGRLEFSLNFYKHIKPSLVFFGISVFSVSLSGIENILIGFLDTLNPDKSVGLFSNSKKIILLLLSMVSSILVINYSRLSYLLSLDDNNTYKSTLSKTTNFITFTSFLVFGIIFSLSKDIIILFSGSKFIEADFVFKLLSIVFILTTIKSTFESHILNPAGKENLVMISNLTGWILSVALCFMLVPSMSFNGAGIALIVGSLVTFIILLIASINTINHFPFTKETFFHFMGGLIIIALNYIIYPFIPTSTSLLTKLFYTLSLALLYSFVYIVFLLTLKDSTIFEIWNYTKGFISKILKIK